ncbi:MAG: hypothetical protein P4L53_21420 [Candidatus Obscuribacterales bacterium]|nr:hypothetical protein [Candidatus Obscuribacterales bacterium]
MSQPSPIEKAGLTPADAPLKKEPDDKSKLSNGVWESIKQDYIKPLSWVEGNVVAPLYNEAFVKPVNTVIDKAEKLHVPISKFQAAAVPEAGVTSAAFYAQQFSSTAGNLGWQLGVGLVAGKYLRAGGEALAVKAEAAGWKLETAQSIRNFAARRELANVTGATLYAAAIDPEKGQTRTGNAFAAGEGMLLFEGSNKLIGSTKFLDAKAMGLRALAGAPIGASQQFFSTLISTGNVDVDPTHYEKAMVSGAFMNTMLPGAMKGIEAIAPKFGVNAYADRFAEQQHQSALASLKLNTPAEPGSWADPKAAGLAISAGRMDITAKARSSTTEETNIDHTKGLITLKTGDSPSQFVEENAHIRIARDPKFEVGFARATESIEGGKTEEARQEYIQTRVAQEVEAHTARYEAIQKSGAKSETTSINPVEIAKEYAGKFALEAQAFIQSGGKFRPEMSFSHGGGIHAGGDGVAFTQNVGIGPGASHDGAPHTPGDTHTALDGDQTAARLGTVDRSALLKDFPKDAIATLPTKPGEPWTYTWPNGVRVFGHDNVQTLSFTSADLSEVVLTKIDPMTKEVSSMVRNYAEGQTYKSTADGPARFTFTEWEQNLHTGHNIYQIEKPGTWNLPEKSTWETYPRRIALEIAGQPVWVSSILRHNDASGRIDYGLSDIPTQLTEFTKPQPVGDYPETLNPATGQMEFNWKPGDPVALNPDGKPAFFLYQRTQQHTDGSITDYVYDPRKLDPTFPRDQLMPDSSIDSFAPDSPLATSLGNFENIHRMSDELRYQSDNETKQVQFGGDKLKVITHKAGEAPAVEYLDSIKEKYPNGRDTVWGTAIELEIKPKSMIATLKDGGKVEIYNSTAYPDGAPFEKLKTDGTVDERFANNRFGNVRRVDTAPPTKDANGNTVEGEITLVKEIKSSEGIRYSNVHVPPAPFAIKWLPDTKADAFEEFPGATVPRTFYLSDKIGPNGEKIPYGTIETKLDGFSTDGLLKDSPYDAVWRYPLGVSYLKNVANGANNWTKSSIIFEDPESNRPPLLIHNNDVADDVNQGNIGYFSKDDLQFEHNGQFYPKPLLTENYPFGQTTPWGTAFNRATYGNGLALMGMKDGSQVILNEKGQFVQRIPAQTPAQ